MRRLAAIVARAAIVAAVVGVVRAVLLDRQPRQGIEGDQRVIGSLDTWPEVPRKPSA